MIPIEKRKETALFIVLTFAIGWGCWGFLIVRSLGGKESLYAPYCTSWAA
jgi:hypothetical protein